MKIQVNEKWLIGGALVAAVVVYIGIKNGTDAALQAINPTSDQNLAYRGTSAVVETLTGGKSLTLGDWLYNVFNAGEPGT